MDTIPNPIEAVTAPVAAWALCKAVFIEWGIYAVEGFVEALETLDAFGIE